jgi:hypothetical protein
MGLADRLATPPKRTTGPTCSVGRLLARLDKADADALNAAMLAKSADGSWVWPETNLEAEIKAEGETVGAGSVGKHRRKQCGCWE